MAVEFDAGKTKIGFVLSDVLHTVRGTFQLKEGHISFDSSLMTITGSVIVDARSGHSGNAIRDKRMTHNILEAERYPEVRFMPLKLAGPIQAAGPSDVQVGGSLMIHGEAHEITFPVRIQMSPPEIRATGRFTIPYVDWGMKNPSTFLLKVSDKVEIDIDAIGRLGGPGTH